MVLIFIIGFGIAALSSLAAKLYADYDWLNVLIIMYTALVVWYSYTFYKYHRKIRQLKQLR
ncbi:hypothetical protein ACTHOQ_00225 [Solibacillus silvestris]|uniref:hypothetical protein n=1 Tax=Solibacillus silvestris TaxID=76853 RepID=UPI003F820DD8